MPSGSSKGPKSRRFVHIAPALPNGLKDIVPTVKNWKAADPRQRVNSLLNPCTCENVWNCRCRASDGSQDSNLATLAQVATMSLTGVNTTFLGDIEARKHDRDTPSHNTSTLSKKRRKVTREPFRGPELPPLLLDDEDAQPATVPQFATKLIIPSLKSVASLAGTGCCCGFTCACPGCIEHRVPLLSELSEIPSSLRDCADGCGHCVDNQVEDDTLPAPPQTIMDEFLARAATLPIPPRNRFVNLDPTNITVFPSDMFSKEREDRSYLDVEQQARAAWGLVEVPKLDCCKGMCGCPDGNCGCGKSCGGCCAEDEHDKDLPVTAEDSSKVTSDESEFEFVGDCCSCK